MNYNFVQFFGLSLCLDCFWSRNLPVSISVSFSKKLSSLGLDVCGVDYITSKRMTDCFISRLAN